MGISGAGCCTHIHQCEAMNCELYVSDLSGYNSFFYFIFIFYEVDEDAARTSVSVTL